MLKGGLAAGTAPNRIGADRNGAPVEEVDVDELYKANDPVGLQKKWSIGEVARIVTALPDLHLPWKKGVLSSSMEALDEAAFKAGIKDSTTPLVDADLAAGNCAFGGSGLALVQPQRRQLDAKFIDGIADARNHSDKRPQDRVRHGHRNLPACALTASCDSVHRTGSDVSSS